MKTGRTIRAALLVFLLAIAAHAQAPATCAVSGTLYNPDATPAVGAQVRISKVTKNGVLIAPGPFTYTANGSGVVTFSIIRGATVYIYSTVAPFNVVGGVVVLIPNTATADLSTLATVATVPTTGITVTTLPSKEGTLNFNASHFIVTEPTPGEANIALSFTPLADVMTTRGDILYRNSSNVTARLGRGSANTVLSSDGTDLSYSQVTNAMLAGSIADTKLLTISTAGKVADSALSSNIPLKNGSNAFTGGSNAFTGGYHTFGTNTIGAPSDTLATGWRTLLYDGGVTTRGGLGVESSNVWIQGTPGIKFYTGPSNASVLALTLGSAGEAVFEATVTIPTPFTLGAVSVLPTGTEINFVDGVTSNIQTQLDGKQAGPLTGDVTTSGAAATLASTVPGNRKFSGISQFGPGTTGNDNAFFGLGASAQSIQVADATQGAPSSNSNPNAVFNAFRRDTSFVNIQAVNYLDRVLNAPTDSYAVYGLIRFTPNFSVNATSGKLFNQIPVRGLVILSPTNLGTNDVKGYAGLFEAQREINGVRAVGAQFSPINNAPNDSVPDLSTNDSTAAIVVSPSGYSKNGVGIFFEGPGQRVAIGSGIYTRPNSIYKRNIDFIEGTYVLSGNLSTSGTAVSGNLTVSGATNATPIVITTTTNHGLTDSAKVVIISVGGNTAANGTFWVDNLSSTTFALYSNPQLTSAVAGNGAYTSGGTVGTTYFTQEVLAGEYLNLGGTYYEVSSVTNDGALVLVTSAGTQSGLTAVAKNVQPLRILPNSFIVARNSANTADYRFAGLVGNAWLVDRDARGVTLGGALAHATYQTFGANAVAAPSDTLTTGWRTLLYDGGTTTRGGLGVESGNVWMSGAPGLKFYTGPSNAPVLALTLTSTQTAVFASTVAASGFAGDGSALTGLEAGDISSGTLPVGRGGTGASTFTLNGVLYGNSAASVLVTAQGAANSILTANAGAPVFSQTPIINTSLQLGVAASVTGVLKLAVSGDANITTLQAGDVPASAVVYKWPANNPAPSEFLKVTSFGGGIAVLGWAAPAGGGDALTTNPLSQFAATTSAQAAGVISDETGSGAVVFAIAPALSGLAFTPTDVTVAAGANADLNIGNATNIRLSGAGGAFSVDSFTGGAAGRILYVLCSIAQAMTIKNEGTGSAANRIATLTGADVTLRATPQSFATFIYDATFSRWLLVATN
ncbi:MAG: hypothetical protein AABN33_18490 [Acidobacteriota bacterium]